MSRSYNAATRGAMHPNERANEIGHNSTVASRLGGQTSLVFAGYLFTLLVGFPLQIYVSRRLGADGMGVYGLLEGLTGTVAGLIGFGIAPTLVRFIPQHLERREYANLRFLVLRGGLILLTAGLLAGVGFVLVFPFLARWWPDLAGQWYPALVMSALVPLGLLLFFLQQALRGFQAMRDVTLGTSVLQLLAKAALAILLLGLGLQVAGFAWAVVGSVSIACLWMGWRMWRRVAALPAENAKPSEEQTQQWKRFSGLMYANSLLGVLTQYADRFLLGLFAGAGPVGVLVTLAPLSQMPVIALTMLISVVAPMFAAAHARHDNTELVHLYRLSTDWAVRLSLPLILFLFVFHTPVLSLYGKEFADTGATAFRILLLAAALNLLTGPLGNLLNMSGQEKPLLWLNVQQTLLLVAAYAVMVPAFGITGAALSMLASTAYSALRGLALARRVRGIGWWDSRYRIWLLPSICTVAVAVGLRLTGEIDGPVWLVLALAVLYVVFLGGIVMQGLGEDDRALLSHLRTKLPGRFGGQPSGVTE